MASYQANQMAQVARDVSPVASRQGQISEQFERLSNAVSAVASLTAALEERLSGVAMPQPPQTPSNTKDAPEPMLVPVAEALKIQTTRLTSVCCQVESLLSRLEL